MATQKNLPPIAALTADKTEITLPDNKITVDASASKDPMKNGRVVRAEFFADAGAVIQTPIISEPTVYKTDVTFSKEGTYNIGVNVFDRSDLKSTTPAIIPVIVHPKPIVNKPINFGLKVVGLDATDQITVANKMGVTMLRTSVEVEPFTGKAKFIDDVFAAGLMANVNINWQAAGNVKKYCTDLVKYEKNLRWIYDVYAPKGGVRKIKYAFCENEPTNDGYYNDKIENYIPVLKTFARVSNEYGVPCACGGVFIEYIYASFSGGVPNNQNYKDNMWLIDQMVNIPLTHANVHYAIKGTFKTGVISSAMQWLGQKLKRPVGTNEFHIDGASTFQVSLAMQEFIGVQPDFVQAWGGGNGSAGDPVNIGTDLTAWGVSMRDVIADYNKNVG